MLAINLICSASEVLLFLPLVCHFNYFCMDFFNINKAEYPCVRNGDSRTAHSIPKSVLLVFSLLNISFLLYLMYNFCLSLILRIHISFIYYLSIPIFFIIKKEHNKIKVQRMRRIMIYT